MAAKRCAFGFAAFVNTATFSNSGGALPEFETLIIERCVERIVPFDIVLFDVCWVVSGIALEVRGGV